MTPEIVLDVSGLVRRYRRRPSGIERVQIELASALADGAAGDADVAFCAFDPVARVYEPVPAAVVVDKSDALRGGERHASPVPSSTARVSSRRLVDAVIHPVQQRSPAAGDHLHRSADQLARAVREARVAARAAAAERRARRHPPPCASDGWSATTTYCSVGADWVDGDLGYLAARCADRGFGVVLMIHDLIPVVAPQFVQSDIDFGGYVAQVLAVADTVVVNSQATAADVRAFAAERDLEVPRLAPIPLGSDLVDEVPVVPPPPVGADAPVDGDYVLAVGSLEPRKNQRLLLDVWEMLVSELGQGRAPRLVVAGQRGSMDDQTVRRLTHTPELRGVVSWIEGPSDPELAWLYRHCAFTVFPSQYEGWGLPVSESHDFGKLCLAADTSSLPEAGEGLADLLDPFDRRAWKERILRSWTDGDLVARREAEILLVHHHVTRADTARALIEIAKGSRGPAT